MIYTFYSSILAELKTGKIMGQKEGSRRTATARRDHGNAGLRDYWQLVLTIFRSVTFMCASSSGLPDLETLVFSFWLTAPVTVTL